jgi:uncharacterized protein (TIGR03083 family)
VPDHSPEETIGALDETWSATALLCATLPPESWDLPTDCPGWSVRDHISHLIGTELTLFGTSAPPRPDPMPAYVHNTIGEGNEAWIQARRDVPGSEMVAEFAQVTADRLEQLRAFPQARWDEVGWTPIGDAPYAEFMRLRIMDSWVHGQDIRWAADRPGERAGRGERVALARLGGAMTFVVGRQVAPPDGTTVVFQIDGPIPTVLAVAMEGKRASFLGDPPASPTTRLGLSADHFVRLTCGRESPDDVIESGDLTLQGDEELAKRIIRSMNFMI